MKHESLVKLSLLIVQKYRPTLLKKMLKEKKKIHIFVCHVGI